jgi:hypothetical protein
MDELLIQLICPREKEVRNIKWDDLRRKEKWKKVCEPFPK